MEIANTFKGKFLEVFEAQRSRIEQTALAL
jgi:hypothetical protein